MYCDLYQRPGCMLLLRRGLPPPPPPPTMRVRGSGTRYILLPGDVDGSQHAAFRLHPICF